MNEQVAQKENKIASNQSKQKEEESYRRQRFQRDKNNHGRSVILWLII